MVVYIIFIFDSIFFETMEFVLALLLVGISFLALGFNIFFRQRKFPETEIGKNKVMRAQGIQCAKCEEHAKWKRMQKKKKSIINPSELKLVK